MLQTSDTLRSRPAQDSPRRAAAQPAGHRDFLDGVRGLAALWVVLSHLWIIPCGLAAQDNWLGRLTNWTLYSHFAVDIFIVLSGYCLILPVAGSGGTLRGGARRFFERRARRILPPFYAALAFSVLVFLVIQALSHQRLQVPLPALLANVFLLQDILLQFNCFNGPFWSIAVEWRIYFLFPLLAWVLRRHGKRGVLTLAALAGGAMTVALLRLHPDMLLACPWYLLLFALGLCAGSVSMQGEGRWEKRLCLGCGALSSAGLIALVHAHPITTLGGTDFGAFLPAIDPALGLGAAAALLWVSRSPGRVPLLSWRPLVSLGTFAYSLYLVHLPCLLLLNALVTLYLPARTPLSHVFLLLTALPLVLGAARLFFFAFEEPFLSGRQQAQQRA